MPTWFRLTYKETGRPLLRRLLATLARVTKPNSAVWVRFWAAFAKDEGALSHFFRDMFTARGLGLPFMGRSWDPLSDEWVAKKDARGWDPQIGRRLGDLLASLTEGDAPGALRRAKGNQMYFGSSVVNRIGRPNNHYAGYFNARRPVIDDETAAELLRYLESRGKAEFDVASVALKEAIIGSIKSR